MFKVFNVITKTVFSTFWIVLFRAFSALQGLTTALFIKTVKTRNENENKMKSRRQKYKIKKKQ